MMIRNLNSKKGFTLIELMVVVAIIGILAAIAVPNFLAMQLRSKRAELPANLDAIRTIEQTYVQEWSDYFATPANPKVAVAIDTEKHEWDNTLIEWNKLGWKPEGAVFGKYAVDSSPTGTASKDDEFLVTGISDLDGDGPADVAKQAGYFATRDTKPIFSCTGDAACEYMSTVGKDPGVAATTADCTIARGKVTAAATTCIPAMATDKY